MMVDIQTLARTSEFTNSPGFVHRWKISDQLAQKSGFRKTIVSIKGNAYTGEWADNKKEGDGHQMWAESGREYKGTWKNDMRHGFGTLWEPIDPPTRPLTTSKSRTSNFPTSRNSTRPNTNSKVSKNSMTNSKILGVIDPEDNLNLRMVYEGGWLWDKMHGNGRRFYRNGDVYDGEWINGERHGFGTIEYGNGDVYEGEWANGKRHGKGVLFYKNEGNRYEGFWSNDKKDGKGTFYYAAKKQKMDGEWLDDICKCGTMIEFNATDESNNSDRKSHNSSLPSPSSSSSLSSSGSSSSLSVPAAPLPEIYLIDSEKVLREQEEMIQRMREMRTTKGDDELNDDELEEYDGEEIEETQELDEHDFE